MQHVSWLAHEYATLQLLHTAGCAFRSPWPSRITRSSMEYVGEMTRPAPTLQSVTLTRKEAAGLFDRLMADVERMLASGRVHADLSAFNVLYWGGDYRIIDFPQTVDPAVHPSAFPLFERDVTRLCQYFPRCGIAADPTALAAEVWARVGPVRTTGWTAR